MPRAYSVDLRERSLRALTSGPPAAEVARLFDVSVSSLSRRQRQQRTTGDLTPGRATGGPRATRNALEPRLVAQVAAQPDATLAEHCAQWAMQLATVLVSPTTMGRTLQRLGLPLKKRPWSRPSGMRPRGVNGWSAGSHATMART